MPFVELKDDIVIRNMEKVINNNKSVEESIWYDKKLPMATVL